MDSIKKYFDVQMGMDVCPAAKVKLLKKIMPILCVDNNICPLCSEDLKITDSSVAYVNADKKCLACKAVYRGDKSYGRPDIKSASFIQ